MYRIALRKSNGSVTYLSGIHELSKIMYTFNPTMYLVFEDVYTAEKYLQIVKYYIARRNEEDRIFCMDNDYEYMNQEETLELQEYKGINSMKGKIVWES